MCIDITHKLGGDNLRKDIEIISDNEKTYIDDISKYSYVSLRERSYASKVEYVLTLTIYIKYHEYEDCYVCSENVNFYFSNKENAENYYEQIKKIMNIK